MVRSGTGGCDDVLDLRGGGGPEDACVLPPVPGHCRLHAEAATNVTEGGTIKSSYRGPRVMLAEFSISPVGAGARVGKWVARCLDIVDRSGLPYRLGAMGTTVEGGP